VEVIRVAPYFYPIVTGTSILYGGREAVCFPSLDRQVGVGNVCLPVHLRKRLLFNCLLDTEFLCFVFILVLTVVISFIWSMVNLAKGGRRNLTRASYYAPKKHQRERTR